MVGSQPFPWTPRATFDPAFFVPFENRLRSLYGSTPHRISHPTAMSMARVAIKASLAVDVSGPPADPETAKRLKVLHREESAETLGGSRPLGAAPLGYPNRNEPCWNTYKPKTGCPTAKR